MNIDTVAEAIFSKDAKPGTAVHWRAVDSQTRTHYRAMAQAAIDAMHLTEERSIGTPGRRDIKPHARLVSPWVEVSS